MRLKIGALVDPVPSREDVAMTNIPVGLPETHRHNGREYKFDCIAGNGDPIYQYVKESGEKFHILLIFDK